VANAAPQPLSARRRVVFAAIAVLLPFALLGGAELVLRAAWRGGATPLFVPAISEGAAPQISVNPVVARRWFLGRGTPAPGAIVAPFPLHKPPHTLRIFAMGESTTAGFPYPHTATFARVLQTALQDVLPSDSVEVINLGIAGTSSYALVDEAAEVIAQHPDAVVIYAGHNEFYGALGVGSTQAALGRSPFLVRAFLLLQRLRLVVALRYAVEGAGSLIASSGGTARQPATLMDAVAGSQEIPLGSPLYERGENQFASNLSVLLDRFRAARVPVFIGSQASNVRDQRPLAVAANAGADAADGVFSRANAAWVRGDSAQAESLFVRARDLDVVRFRASTDFNAIIRAAAAAHGAVYVPVEERVSAAALGGAPGHDLFLEHLHPNVQGMTVMAHAYFDAIASADFLGRVAQPARLRSWGDYAREVPLSPFDEKIVRLATDAVSERWPFVPLDEQRDVRGEFHASTLEDTLALEVAAGGSWQAAKVRLGQSYAQRGFADSAVVELRGVALGSPTFAEPWEYLGGAFMQAHQPDSAYAAYRHALAIRPSAPAATAAAMIALGRHDYAAAIPMLQMVLAAAPDDPPTLYRLSLSYAVQHDIPDARAAAARLARVAPTFPDLANWLSTLGMGG